MVNLGFVTPDRSVPAPDLSYVRMFGDNSIGWKQKGQYVTWTGASTEPGNHYRLFERVGKRVAPIVHADGSPVFHKIAADVPFTIESLLGCWLALDSDAMWLDTPHPGGRYAVLAVGGTTSKPGAAVVDWMCPHCGTALNRHELKIASRGFAAFLKQVDEIATEFDSDSGRRTCPECGTVHPPIGTPATGSSAASR